MTLSNTSILYIIELAIYLTLFPLTLYLAHRHGRHGLLGYLYLNLFCAVRIAADVVQLIERNQSSGHPSLIATILSSIGLSPLILALAGFLHETHYHLLTTTTTNPAKAKKAILWLYFAQLQIHTVSVTGMVLVIIGSIQLIKAKTISDANKDDKLRSAGALLLMFLWLCLAQYAGWLFYQCRQARTMLRQSVLELAKWSLVVVPFIGVKVAYAVAYTFDHGDAAISPVTGSFGVKLVLVVGVALVAALAMTFAGWRSADIAGRGLVSEKIGEESEFGTYEGSRLMTQKQ